MIISTAKGKDCVIATNAARNDELKAQRLVFRVFSLSTRRCESCVLCGHKAGRTNKRHHFAAKHAEINSDDHPTVRARLQAIAQAPPILSSFASAPKAKPVTIRAVEFFAAHGTLPRLPPGTVRVAQSPSCLSRQSGCVAGRFETTSSKRTGYTPRLDQ
jgi:hypothetical protein